MNSAEFGKKMCVSNGMGESMITHVQRKAEWWELVVDLIMAACRLIGLLGPRGSGIPMWRGLG